MRVAVAISRHRRNRPDLGDPAGRRQNNEGSSRMAAEQFIDHQTYHNRRARWWEVGVYWASGQWDRDEQPDIVAQFRCQGDAYSYATALATRPVYMYAVVVR